MNSEKSESYFENYSHMIGDMGHTESDNPNSAYMVVHVVHSWVGFICVK